MMTRRSLLIAPALVPFAAAPALAGVIPENGRIAFDVSRNGSAIGTHTLAFRRDGEAVQVDIAIDLAVRILGIAVYRYTHRNAERWQNERLVSMASTTDKNGKPLRVRADRRGPGVEVDGTEGGRFLAPSDIVTTSYWHPGFIRATKLDTQGGRILNVTVADRGEETIRVGAASVPARRWRIDGDLSLDIWYDRNGAWSKLRFAGEDGSTIDYARR